MKLKQKDKEICLKRCLPLLLVLISIMYAFLFQNKFEEIQISSTQLYGKDNQNLKDFEIIDGNLVSTSDDPWIDYEFESKVEIACIRVDVNAVDAKGGIAQIFNKESWNSVRKKLHKGTNYFETYTSSKIWKAQNIRLDLIEREEGTVNVEQIIINPEFFVWLIGFIKMFILAGVLLILFYAIKKASDNISKLKNINKLFNTLIKMIFCIVASYFVLRYFRVNYNLLIVTIMSLVIYLMSRKLERKNICFNEINLCMFIFSGLFGIACIMGYHIEINGSQYFGTYTDNFISKYGINDIFGLISIAIVTYIILGVIYNRLHKVELGALRNKNITFVTMTFFFVCWLPYFLVYYPGFIFGDSCSSIYQAINWARLNNHHPILYTLFIKLCINIGQLYGNLTLGCAIYTLLQMIFVGYSLGRSIDFLYKKGVKKVICIGISVFYGISPFFAQVSISMWKDPIFSATVLLWTLFLIDEVNGKIENKKKGMAKNATFILLMCFSRNNGIYIALFCTLMSILAEYFGKKKELRFLNISSLAAISVVIIVTGPIYNRLGVSETEKVESYGIFLNQMARIQVYEGKMSEEEHNFMGEMLPVQKYKEAYRPCVVDLLKWDSEFNTEFVNTHSAEFIRHYISMVIKNPKLAFEGWELTTYGYWAPNRLELLWDDQNIGKGNLGDIYNSGLDIEPKNLLENGVFDFTKVIKNTGTIINMALVNWMIFFIWGCTAVKKEKSFIALLPSVGLIVTLFIASPYYYWQRYGLALYYLIPIYIYLLIVCFQKEKGGNDIRID